jgi:16S rRNA (adenine1518-N6/adenine1519-N6)-dimethyltransferase
MTRPKRSLGQNFLVDPVISRRIVEASQASAGDSLLEIGPGRGALSELLARVGRPLLLLEIDDGLVEGLRRRFDGDAHVQIVHGDAMTVDLDALPWPDRSEGAPRRIVANLPYNVASRIALRFLAWGGFDDATFMFQREVALRFASLHGSRTYGGLSVMGRVYADAYPLFPVPPQSFRPVPKVDSHVVRFKVRDCPRIPAERQPWFEAVVRGLFQHRRKTTLNSLQRVPGLEIDAPAARKLLEGLGVEPERRPESLSFEEFDALAVATESLQRREV